LTSFAMHERRNERITELGEHYWQKMQGETPSLFDRKYWQGQLLDWVMNDELFKVDAFRFIDVLPALKSTSAIGSHVQDYLLKEKRDLPLTVRTALKLTTSGIASPLAAKAIRANVTAMARRFISESDSDKAVKVFAKLAKKNLTFTADILGEATISDEEAESYLQKYIDLITRLGNAAERWPANPLLYESPAGPLPRANISVKISALDPYMDAVDHQGSIARLKERVLPLLRLARQKNVFINFDLEQWAAHDITYDLFEEVSCHQDLIDWPHIGLVIQAYLKTSPQDCDRLLAFSKRRGTPFTVRLVKGAYWDYEVVNARQYGFTCPVFTRKGLTDANYEQLTNKLIDNHAHVTPAFASHNLRSLVHAIVAAEENGVDKTTIELQMLYGMAEPLRRIFSQDGYRMRIYAPIGELIPGMAYLVRRLLENTSNSGFLRQSYHDKVSISSMLEPPVLEPEELESDVLVPGDLDSSFTNVNLLDFCDPEVRDRFAKAIAEIPGQLPLDVPLVVNGAEIHTEDVFIHTSPNDPAMEVTRQSRAEIAHADQAIQVALKVFPTWRDKPLNHRAGLIEKLAGILEKNRFELAALQTYEVGKPWREADADVAEAIDFCRFYARQARIELGPTKQGNLAGEDNVLFYEGRGPTIIIAPWNFPLAILCGMTTAALVAGNTVLIKPATTSTGIGYRFYQYMIQVGFPPDVVQFLPGSGEKIGSYLVTHPATSQIAFTGSKEVGLEIIELAGKLQPEQKAIKRVVCEMGGKNGIIIDDDADLDAALKGVMQSAFGYAGQKCSACSRLIVVGSIYDTFMDRLKEACRSLPIGAATDPTCRLGPVIDRRARDRLNDLIAKPPEGSSLFFRGETLETGYFVPPAIFEVNDASNPMMQLEFFGPVLTVIRAADFEAALDIANSTEFALTGAVYTRSPSNMEHARTGFKVGNLYINRGCTGAIVDRQPFGGFGMSGFGTKAGGPGYLRLFANPRCISENTMRSGFTPDLQM
jgi:RHH-type proline utilization regulon transcriptional repressor/proline dehydrogenase/delta 1-pyrroline-5-carboxylate dehydrogenase